MYEQRARLFRELDLVGICSLRIKESGVKGFIERIGFKGPLDPDAHWKRDWVPVLAAPVLRPDTIQFNKIRKDVRPS